MLFLAIVPSGTIYAHIIIVFVLEFVFWFIKYTHGYILLASLDR